MLKTYDLGKTEVIVIATWDDSGPNVASNVNVFGANVLPAADLCAFCVSGSNTVTCFFCKSTLMVSDWDTSAVRIGSSLSITLTWEHDKLY